MRVSLPPCLSAAAARPSLTHTDVSSYSGWLGLCPVWSWWSCASHTLKRMEGAGVLFSQEQNKHEIVSEMSVKHPLYTPKQSWEDVSTFATCSCRWGEKHSLPAADLTSRCSVWLKFDLPLGERGWEPTCSTLFSVYWLLTFLVSIAAC